MAPVTNIRQNKSGKAKKSNVTLVFDEKKRKEFLGGFHKRKLQRKKVAQENLERQLKEERKRLKHDAKENYKKLVVSARPIPGLEELFTHEYETNTATVKVTELTDAHIANQNCWIGPNRPIYKEVEEEQEASNDEDKEKVEHIAGMDLKAKKVQISKEKNTQEFKTERDVKRVLKKQATKNVQKSKAFQMKTKLENNKNRKKTLHQKKVNEKFMKGKKRGHGKGKHK